MPRVVHFEIHADDPERAISFYQSVFGWQFQKWEGPLEYWMIITGPEGTPGINGGLVNRSGETLNRRRLCNRLRVHHRRPIRRSLRRVDRRQRRHHSSPQDAHTRRWLAGLRQGHRRQHLRSPPGGPVRRLISRNRLLSDCH